jgi:hypothetical protein
VASGCDLLPANFPRILGSPPTKGAQPGVNAAYPPKCVEVVLSEDCMVAALPDAYDAKVLSSQSYATRWKRTCAPPSQCPSAPCSAVNRT